MLQLILPVSLIFLQTLHCSLVIDSFSQQGIHLSEFCPKMDYCAEGAHVMCMYYDPNHIMGPRCTKPKNVSITPALAEKLLEVTNAIRSKVAIGKEKGKDDQILPRGYGLFRLKWDSELATFAQVLANQCVLRHDICRATKRFSDPGQTAGLVRFSYPGWFPVSQAAYFSKPGLTVTKLAYGVTQSLKSWYNQKTGVTSAMIASYPNWEQNPSHTLGRLYLEMIYGPATHMGCGISAYTEYAHYDNNAPLNYNSIQVICNFSSRPRKGHAVYELNPPTQAGYTVRCGCPPGTEEDQDCLCYDSPRQAITDPTIARAACSGKSCKPAVVLLPIFTVENAPPEMLIGRSGPERPEPEVEIMDYYGPNDTSAFLPSPLPEQINVNNVLENIIHQVQKPPQPPAYQFTTTTKKPAPVAVKNRFFTKKSVGSYKPKMDFGLNHAKKQSIFSKVPTFGLHKLNATFRSDVQPRRDFSNVQDLVKNYMISKKNRLDNLRMSKSGIIVIPKSKLSNNHLNLNSAEEKVMSYNYYLKNKSKMNTSLPKKTSLSDFEFESSSEKSHDNLMHLLDKLEQEVKHIELDGSKKEIFDAKIRKIYGTVVKKPMDISGRKLSDSDYLSDSELSDRYTDLEYMAKKIHNKRDDVDDLGLNTKRMFRPITRNRNSLLHDKSDKENLQSKKDTKKCNDISKKCVRTGVYVNSDDGEIKFRHVLTDQEEKIRGLLSEPEETRKMTYITDKRKPKDHDNYNDPLGIDRRKYYQERLDNLEKKLHTSHFKHHTAVVDHHNIRPLLPTAREEQPLRPGKSQMDPFYLPERARFVHGF